MEPFFTNDAVVFGLLMILLAGIFYTSHLDKPSWKKFYTYVPALLLCYFLPAILHWPLGLVASEWFDPSFLEFLSSKNLVLPDSSMSFSEIKNFLEGSGIAESEYKSYIKHSNLYFMASRYLLPASLVLLCLSIDFKGIINLGPKALIMFFAATLGIVIGGPIALLVVLYVAPDLFSATPDEIWRGLSTVAGSWIGGGANQTAMKEVYNVGSIFTTMVVVDVVVANIWMGFLLYGANISDRLDIWLKADASAIEDLKQKVADYRASIAEMPTTTSLFVMLGIAFGAVALSHWGADVVSASMKEIKETLAAYGLNSLASHFFWLVVFATTIGLTLSFTKARKLEGIGASRWGSIFIYILVATIGMHMNVGDVFSNLGLFAVGLVWMAIHVIILLFTAKIIKAPFFFVAVGSQANVGGAASAPIVASAFSPSLAPVGVLMAVLGYAIGTYGAIICAELMRVVATSIF
ncbi:MAG: DUF819 family protein [Bacteroidetes bacterium]|jgi:uncharacterized membrane protein|nr:DUF819 family protein [Bacteroidota bacterium]